MREPPTSHLAAVAGVCVRGAGTGQTAQMGRTGGARKDAPWARLICLKIWYY